LNGNNRPYNQTTDIYFDVPKDLKTRGCIRIRYFMDEDKAGNYACIDIDLKGLFKDLEINPDVVQIFLATDDSRTLGRNDLNMIYWSKMYNTIAKRNPTDEDTEIIDPVIDFNRTSFNNIGLSSDTLFNGIYYNILDQIDTGGLNKTKTQLLGSILGEYNHTMYNLKQAMGMHNYSNCESYIYKESKMTTEMTFGNLYYNIVKRKEGKGVYNK
jgi:hypothetical protein